VANNSMFSYEIGSSYPCGGCGNWPEYEYDPPHYCFDGVKMCSSCYKTYCNKGEHNWKELANGQTQA